MQPIPYRLAMPRPGRPVIDRREAVRRVAVVLGGTLSAPTLSGLLAGCESPRGEATYLPRTLSARELQRVEAIAELIIPTTDTPGASAARVQDFVDMMLTDFFSPAERGRFLRQLAVLDDRMRASEGVDFDAASSEQRSRVLTELDAEAFSGGGEGPDRPEAGGPPFMRTMKELTVAGFYTSEVGQTVELHVAPFGPYEADLSVDEVGRAWA
jgi:hypothetical protein